MADFTNTEAINKELFSANPSLMVEFFSISDIKDSSETIRFHGGMNEIGASIVFNKKEYFYLPFQSSGFVVRADGSLPRPSLKIINVGGLMSSYIKDKDDLIGATIVRSRTFLRFLDAINFHDYENNLDFWKGQGVNPDPNSKLADEKWIINRKVAENKSFVEYELTSPLDLENTYVPKRQIINNYCSWKYRGKGCNYSGDPVADANNGKFSGTLVNKGEWASGQSYVKNNFVYVVINEGENYRKVFYVCISDHTSSKGDGPTVNTDDWAADECSKSLGGCKLRFSGENEQGKHMPFGGFPGSRLF